MWRGSGRRTRTHSRLVPQSADPHLRRLSISGNSLYHVIRWNVSNLSYYEPGREWLRDKYQGKHYHCGDETKHYQSCHNQSSSLLKRAKLYVTKVIGS